MQNSKFQFKIQNFKKTFHFSLFTFHFRQRRAGFTLVELLVVMMIIGVLFAILLVNFKGVKERTRDGQRKSDLRQIQSALEMYRADQVQGRYPDSLPDCGSSLTGVTPPTTYMQKVPCDPQGGNYTYSLTAGTTYSIMTCLENVNDSQKDVSNNAVCGSTKWSFTLQNP